MCREEDLQNNNYEKNTFISRASIGTDYKYKHTIIWKNVFAFLILHVFAAFGMFKLLTGALNYTSLLWFCFLYFTIAESITAGVHRYFAHRCYKAGPILRAYFIMFFTIAGQNSIFIWCRDHRLHHRYSDTDADPHNASRGLFFSHIGWLMMKKHPLVIEMGKKIDMSDLKADSWVMWQYKYFYELFFLVGICFPIAVPVYFGESWTNSILVFGFFRLILCHHITWLINSFAHLYGTRPYDKNLRPVESWLIAFFALGEGWHNYHHTFPWDYKAAEFGMPFNVTASFIRLCERLGLAWDLKTPSSDMVEKRIMRTGDGTHHLFGNNEDRSAVTAFGPVHPLNPTYTKPLPESTLTMEGLPLFHEKDFLNN